MSTAGSRDPPGEKPCDKCDGAGSVVMAMMPHEEWVRLDTTREGQMLTHSLCLRRQVVPREGGPYELEFDESGFGALVGSDGEHVLLLEDWFGRHAYKDGEGHIYIVEAGGAEGNLRWSLLSKQREVVPASAALQLDKEAVDLKLFKVTWPRSGCHYFTSLFQLYGIMGMDSYKGQASKWCYECMPGWEASLLKHGLSNCFLRSNSSISAAEAMFSGTHIVPTPAVSSAGMVFLLAQWAFSSVAKGGLRKVECRTCAAELLKQVVKAACARPFVIDIEADLGWVITWPRPSPASPVHFRLFVSAGGVVDVTEWRLLYERGLNFNCQSHNVALKWYGLAESFVKANGTAQIQDLLLGSNLVGDRGYVGMFNQLAWAVAQRYEFSLLRLGDPDASAEGGPLQPSDTTAGSKDWNPRDVDRICSQHILDSQAACIKAASHCLGLATDKVSARGLGLSNAFATLPTNVAFELVPQVVTQTPDSMVVREGRDAADIAEDMSKRHKAFLKRGPAESTASFRPKKRSRTGAESAMRMLDNQVRVSTPWDGLVRFHLAEEEVAKKRWREWCHVSLAVDQGSDMLSMAHGFQYFEPVMLNCSIFYDGSHGCNRDFWLTVGDHDLRNFLMLMLITLNLPHGPEESDLRYAQVKSAMDSHYQMSSPAMSPLFSKMAGEITMEVGAEPVEGETMQQAVWRSLSHESFYKKKGYKTNIGRFLAIVAEGKKLLNRWATTLFEVAVPCLEYDFLRAAAMPKVRLASTGADESVAEISSLKQVCASDRTLRTCGVNSMVIAFAMLSDPTHQRIMGIVCLIGDHLKQWHASSSKALRSVEDSQKWLLSQLRGECIENACGTLELLCDEDFLRTTRFLPKHAGMHPSWDDEAIPQEDDLAGLAGSFAMCMLRNRLRRNVWMMHFPHCFVLLLGTQAEQEAVLELFKQALKVYRALQNEPNPSALMRQYLARSPMQVLANRQVEFACEEFGFRPAAELVSLIDQRTRTVMQSQGVEDMNNYMKNGKQNGQWGSRYRRPQSGLCTSVSASLLSKVHRFEKPSEAGLAVGLAKPLAREDLAALRPPSLPFSKVATYVQKAPYFSPSAENAGIGSADMCILEELYNRGELRNLGSAWCGFFADAKHCVAFRKKPPPGCPNPGPWYIGLYHYKESACIVVRATCEPAPGGMGFTMLKFLPMASIEFLAVLDLDSWECFGFVWRSWAWQVKRGMSGFLKPGIRAFRDTEITTIMRLSAMRAYWMLPRSELDVIASHLKLKLSSSTSLFDCLFQLVREVLKLSEDETCSVLRQRLNTHLQSSKNTAEILACDEAAQCLKEEDRAEIKHCQERSVATEQEIHDFRSEYKQARARIRNSGGRNRKKKIAWKGPRSVGTLNFAHMAQSEAKKLMPPDSSLWRARGCDSWNSRYLDMPTRSARDSAWGGEEGALRECLRWAWSCFLDSNGYERSECPLSDLWDDQPNAAGAASSST